MAGYAAADDTFGRTTLPADDKPDQKPEQEPEGFSGGKRRNPLNLLRKVVPLEKQEVTPTGRERPMANPIPVSHEANELIALEFETREGFRACVRTYITARPDGYIAAPGRNSVIVPKTEEPWLSQDLKAAKHEHSLVPVGSMGDLPPEEAAEMRRRRGQPINPELRTLEGAKAFLKRLQEEGVQAALHSD